MCLERGCDMDTAREMRPEIGWVPSLRAFTLCEGLWTLFSRPVLSNSVATGHMWLLST